MLILVIFLANLSILAGNVLSDSGVELSITGFSYDLIKQVKKGRVMMSQYNITVTLHNSGDRDSGDIIVLLYDEEMLDPRTNQPLPLNKTTQIEPGDSKTVVFEWSTGLYRNQNITIEYYPKDPNILRNSYNSGSKTFLIEVTGTGSKNGIPDLNIIMMILAVFIGVLIVRKRKRL